MPSVVTSLGSFLGGTGGKGLNALLGAAGTGANIFGSIQNFQQRQKQIDAQNYISSLLKDPTKYNKAVAGYTAPLDAGLTAGITNQVQGQLAERGLGSSPAAFTQAETQALAPYLQQNKQSAVNDLFNMLGLSTGGVSPTQPIDMSKILSQLKLGGGSSDSTLVDTSSDDLMAAPFGG